LSTGDATIHLAIAQVESAVGNRVLRQWSTADDQSHVKRPDSLLCRALLRGVLAEATPLASSPWQIGKAPSGKPFVAGQHAGITPAVSMSHSGGWVACAVTFAGDVGIDIERMRCDRNLSGIAARAFGPLERAEVAAEGCRRFYAIWTLREAMAKAIGTGLASVADGKDRVAGGDHAGFRQVSIDAESWQILQQTLDREMSLAVALRGPADRPVLRWWSAASWR
jgi:phosphopantetheinyl transferase (holo-ACP synthase)